MRKILALVLALTMVLTAASFAFAEQMTEVGTPRTKTLIVETQTPTDVPGQFNCYMDGTQAGFGIHQLLTAHLWEMDTITGEQFGDAALDMPVANDDFTEFTVALRQGCKWSDGEDFNADDVVFTFNMIMNTPTLSLSGSANEYLKSVEKIDDYTVKFTTNYPYPRFATTFGVTIWGCSYYIVPEHIYSQVEDIQTFKDENPVVLGPYTVKDYDPLGQWILYELREDWDKSCMYAAYEDHYGSTPNTPAQYCLVKCLGDDTTRQMAMINNEVDILCEVTPEILEVMMDANENIAAWYKDYPYATSDDPCSKGLSFSIGQGAPYDSVDFRWGIALAMNFEEISMNIFDGVGRASCFPILTATTAMSDLYYKPLVEWLNGFELDLGDGTTVKPFYADYAKDMAATLSAMGREMPTDDEALIDMFGIGCWKYDPEAAAKLLTKAGLEKKDDGWYFNGEPFTIHLTYLADTEAQAGRGVQAAYDQLTKFGLNCSISSESSSSWDTNGGTGEYEIAGYWPTGGITKDIYNQIRGYHSQYITPIGEKTSGQGTRWANAEADAIMEKMASLDPTSDENYELGMEFMKIAIADMPFIGFHSGVKFVPTNSTFFYNYPCSENPYNGPWWWWSNFKYIIVNILPVGE